MRVVSSTTIVAETPVRPLPWVKLAWFGGLIVLCYAPILYALHESGAPMTTWATASSCPSSRPSLCGSGGRN